MSVCIHPHKPNRNGLGSYPHAFNHIEQCLVSKVILLCLVELLTVQHESEWPLMFLKSFKIHSGDLIQTIIILLLLQLA